MNHLFSLVKRTLFFAILILLLEFAAYASGGGEGAKDGNQLSNFIWKTVDFIVLVGLLYWMLAEKIKEFFVGRRKDIKESLEKSAQQKADAEKKYREYSEKLDKASAEIDGIFEMLKAQGVE